MAFFSTRARKVAYEGYGDDDRSSFRSNTRGNSFGISRQSTGDSGVVRDKSNSPDRSNSGGCDICNCSCKKSSSSSLNAVKTKNLLDRRVVSFPPEKQQGQKMKPRASIQRIAKNAPLDQFIKALEQDGGVIVEGFTDIATVEKANEEVRPWLENQSTGAKVGALGGKTRTVTRLIRRSPTVREQFFADPLYQDLCEHFLALTTTTWYGDKPQTNTSHPLLSIAITFDIPPGTPAQGLHRDDKNHHARHESATEYTLGRDMLLGLFVPGCDTTRANGATRVVPGSHLWGDERPDLNPDLVADAEMKRGDAFLMLGSLYHGGGAYEKALHPTAGGSESRTVHAMFCCTGVHRQEEVSFLSYPAEEVKTYSKVVQDRLGWKQSEPNLGWVDLKSPEFLLQ